MNARSLRNKSADFVCYVGSSRADIVTITETWLTTDDTVHRVAITPPGYKLLDCPRSGRAGGGNALLVRDNISVSMVDAGEQKSFEFSEWIVKHGSHKLRTFVIYRPPYSSNHPVTSNVFFDEFASYLESIVMSSQPLLIAVDFNIHVDVPNDPNRVSLLELLESMGLQQHVVTPTHESGHTLDLIITRQCDSVLSSVPVSDYFLSDHCSLLCDLVVSLRTGSRLRGAQQIYRSRSAGNEVRSAEEGEPARILLNRGLDQCHIHQQ